MLSLLNNFEIVATSLIALLIFKEAISKRLWIAIGLITVASIILSVEDISNFSFSLVLFLFYLHLFVGDLKIILQECYR